MTDKSESIDSIRGKVRQAVIRSKETELGYIFIFDKKVQSELSKFIDNEQQCCSFLDFQLDKNDEMIMCKISRANEELDLDVVKEVILA